MEPSSNPVVSVLMPVFRPSADNLRHAILSVFQQTIDDWQLVIVDDASSDAGVDSILAWALLDSRVHVVRLERNQGISGASNAGLEVVTAAWVALLDHDDFLEPDALAAVAEAAAEHPGAEIIYTDRDSVDADNVPTSVFRKPDWSPERLRNNMYLAHLTCVRTVAARDVGGFRSDLDGAQDHDLVLRIAERGAPVVHVPRVLYHWRETATSTAADPGAKPYANISGLRAVQEHMDRVGIKGRAIHTPFAGFYHCDFEPEPCLATVLIPTRGGSGHIGGAERVMVIEAVRSIVEHSYSVDYEIVIVHDQDADPAYLDDLRALAGDRLRIVPFSAPFNFSAKVNLGIQESRGDVVVLLNDDVEVISRRWLDQLVAIAQRHDVGAVGAKLLFEDGSIQHAGHAFEGGQIIHVGAGEPDGPGEFGLNLVDREVTGVTAACLAQRREVWTHLGGLDESLPNNFNDVDYCHRIRAKGYRIVQANSVVLHHFESRTRLPHVHWWEAGRIIDRLDGQLTDVDPFTPDRQGLRMPTDATDGQPGRDLREWIRVTREVLRTEGVGSATRKAGRRVTGRRPAADIAAETAHGE